MGWLSSGGGGSVTGIASTGAEVGATDQVQAFTTGVLSGHLYGQAAANGDILIDGTSHATKATSYVALQPTGGAVAIGSTTASEKLHLHEGNFRFEMVAAPTAPTLELNATAGNLDGVYYYVVTYVTALGETNPSAETTPVTAVTQQVDLTLPTSASASVTARRIYRTTGGGHHRVLRLVAEVAGNVTTAYTDNVADGSLGDYQPGLNTTGGTVLFNGTMAFKIDPHTAVLGAYAFANGTGYANTIFGTNALAANTGGAYNTAVSINSLLANTTGMENTSVGCDNMFSNLTGNKNTSVGVGALALNTAGNNSTAAGYYALNLNLASDNTAFGFYTLYANVNGTLNAGFGAQALQLATGNGNSVFGAFGANHLTSGEGVTAMGKDTFYTLTTNGYGVAIGHQAGYYETGANKLFIDNAKRASEADGRAKALIYGVFAATTAAQTLALNAVVTISEGLSVTGLAGIGTASPDAKLHVVQGNGVAAHIANNSAGSVCLYIQNAAVGGYGIYDDASDKHYLAGIVMVGGDAARGTTAGTNHIDLFNGTAPAGTLTNGVSLYSVAGKLWAMDAAGNATQLTP